MDSKENKSDKPFKDTSGNSGRSKKDSSEEPDNPGNDPESNRDNPGIDPESNRDNPGNDSASNRDNPGNDSASNGDNPGSDSRQGENGDDGEKSLEDIVGGLFFNQPEENFPKRTDKSLANELAEDLSFEEMPLDEEMDARVRELQEITKSIDKRIIRPGDLSLARQYRIDYKNELNLQQLAAVLYTDEPLLVIAGAGSGKTRVITYKVSYLIERGVNPQEILLLTFTKKAATEMMDRVDKLLGDKSGNKVLGGTFHSFANYALRKYGNLIGIRNNFSIIDTEDTADIIDLLKTELNIKGKKYKSPFPRKTKIRSIISRSRNFEAPLEEVIKFHFNENIDYIEEIKKIARALEIYKQNSNLMDYDDLILMLRNKLRDNDRFRKTMQESLKFVLVDEYQDTNNIQREIVEFLVGSGDQVKLTVVGDDFQSIYGFRGANFENILRFPLSFPSCKVVKVEENYRSEQGILNFINEITFHARIGFRKNLFSKRYSGKKPLIKRLSDATEEAGYIVDKVLELKEHGLEFNDFAVLTRASWQSNYVQTELMTRKIPFIVVGGIKFSERRHVKDLVSFVKILINPLDAVAWHRVLQLLEGIGTVRAREIVQVIHNKNGTVDFSALKGRKYYPELEKLQDLIGGLMQSDMAAGPVIDKIMPYYKPILKQLEDDYEIRYRDLEVFRVIASKYDTLEQFINDFTLDPPSNRYQDDTVPLTETDEKPLVVSTIHSAKGLEWHTVFLPFALDGLIPSVRSMGNTEELEEERRLFYVASSRAKENLFITMPAYVASWDAVFTRPCRFLYDMDPSFYEAE